MIFELAFAKCLVSFEGNFLDQKPSTLQDVESDNGLIVGLNGDGVIDLSVHVALVIIELSYFIDAFRHLDAVENGALAHPQRRFYLFPRYLRGALYLDLPDIRFLLDGVG